MVYCGEESEPGEGGDGGGGEEGLGEAELVDFGWGGDGGDGWSGRVLDEGLCGGVHAGVFVVVVVLICVFMLRIVIFCFGGSQLMTRMSLA